MRQPTGGTPSDFYARAVSAAAPTRVVIDCSGPALARALEARPWLVKVNLEELATISPGVREDGLADELEALAYRYGVLRWWITLGPNGALAWEDGLVARGRLSDIEVRNTSGAGDAFLAGLLHAGDLVGTSSAGCLGPWRWPEPSASSLPRSCPIRRGSTTCSIESRLSWLEATSR